MTAVRRLATMTAIVAVVVAGTVASAPASAAKPKPRTVCPPAFEGYATWKSGFIHSTLLKVRVVVTWCYNSKVVTNVTSTCQVVNLSGMVVQIEECRMQGGPFGWGASPTRGGYHVLMTILAKNCLVIKELCWESGVLHLERWFYADGNITTEPRQGVVSGV